MPAKSHSRNHVQYEVDAYVTQDPFTLDHNPRLKKTESVFFDDIDPVTDAPVTTVSTISNSEFDGLGHYRVSEASGFGAATKRKTITDFNPSAGVFPGTHSKPAPSSPWLLNLFTYQETQELNTSNTVLSSARTEVCFDSNTGFLKRKRVLAGGTTGSRNDLLAVFEPNTNGEVATESYYAATMTCRWLYGFQAPAWIRHLHQLDLRASVPHYTRLRLGNDDPLPI